MTPEQARRLSRIIWQDRTRRWLPTVLIGAGLLGGFVWLSATRIGGLDATVEAHMVHGQVMSAARLYGRTGVFRVHARLDDGREVDATSRLQQPPLRARRWSCAPRRTPLAARPMPSSSC